MTMKVLRRLIGAIPGVRSRSVIPIDFTVLADRLGGYAGDESELSAILRDEMDAITARATMEASKILIPNPSAILREHKRFERRFESRLRRTWGRAIDLFDLIRTLSLEFGAEFNRAYRPRAAADHDFVFEALVRLHARGCLTASEVSALLRTGHPTGGNARWRTLHELAVVAMFIAQQGQAVASRYLEHQVIEACRGAVKYQQHCAKLHHEPLDAAEIDRLKNQRDNLITKYGRAYGKDYGWAAIVLSKERVGLGDLARAIDMDHWSPYVRWASQAVHAGARGAFSDLGLPSGSQAMAAGPSQFGLADPAMNSLISLVQLTTALLAQGLPKADEWGNDINEIEWGFVRIVQMNLLQNLLDEAVAEFGRVSARQKEVPVAISGPSPIWSSPDFGTGR